MILSWWRIFSNIFPAGFLRGKRCRKYFRIRHRNSQALELGLSHRFIRSVRPPALFTLVSQKSISAHTANLATADASPCSLHDSKAPHCGLISFFVRYGASTAFPGFVHHLLRRIDRVVLFPGPRAGVMSALPAPRLAINPLNPAGPCSLALFCRLGQRLGRLIELWWAKVAGSQLD